MGRFEEGERNKRRGGERQSQWNCQWNRQRNCQWICQRQSQNTEESQSLICILIIWLLFASFVVSLPYLDLFHVPFCRFLLFALLSCFSFASNYYDTESRVQPFLRSWTF